MKVNPIECKKWKKSNNTSYELSSGGTKIHVAIPGGSCPRPPWLSSCTLCITNAWLMVNFRCSQSLWNVLVYLFVTSYLSGNVSLRILVHTCMYIDSLGRYKCHHVGTDCWHTHLYLKRKRNRLPMNHGCSSQWMLINKNFNMLVHIDAV